VPGASKDPIHVALLGLTGIVADIVRSALASAEDIEIVGGPALSADVAILGLGGQARTDAPVVLLRQYPSLKVLAVEGDGREAALYEMRPHRTELGEISPTTLLEAVRTAAG
jgi:hypothetical protein